MNNRVLLIPGPYDVTLKIALHHFVAICSESIKRRGRFTVALSGGSTPQTLYQHLTAPPYSDAIAWDKVHLFWSDERSVPPDHPESNYKMAMDAGFRALIPPSQVHRMPAETSIESNAALYEQIIQSFQPFDLVMLGVGEDGHTASLFPNTTALTVTDRLVVANHVPQKDTWRMTLTFPCINAARSTVVYVFGTSKQKIIQEIFQGPEKYPAQQIGTSERPSLWILDTDAAALIAQSQ